MRIRRVDAEDPALGRVQRLLAGTRSSVGLAVSPEEGVLLFAGFEDEAVVCAGVFQDYRDPTLHLGNHLEPGRLGDLLERPDVGLFQVALLRSDEERVSLQDAATALIQGFEGWATERFARTCLLITLLQQGNRRARPLYRSLGFKKAGRSSRLMQIPLPDVPDPGDASPMLPDGMQLVFIEDADAADLEGLAVCYRAVFLRGEDAQRWDIADLLGPGGVGPGVSERVSVLLRTAEGRVGGFMLADVVAPGVLHIHAVGLAPELRGRRIPKLCMPLITQRARAEGAESAQFVTAQARVDRLTRLAFRARRLDRLQLHIKIL